MPLTQDASVAQVTQQGPCWHTGQQGPCCAIRATYASCFSGIVISFALMIGQAYAPACGAGAPSGSLRWHNPQIPLTLSVEAS